MTRPGNFCLYDSDGWINIPAIAALPGIWLVVIVGARQVGKTFGTMHHLLDAGNPFIYQRRTIDELELIESDDSLNPFIPMEMFGYHVDIFKSGKLWQIREYETEDDKAKPGAWRGIAPPLSHLAKIRGFNGSIYTDMFYDEFIPETGVVIRHAEGDSVLNAYTTVSGNRELLGKPPLKLWLMANSNNIKNPVMEAFELIPMFEKLIRSQKEWMIKDGVFAAYPRSQKIIEQRKKTALMSWLSDKSRFKKMALYNEFAYNDLELVSPKSLNGLVPYITIGRMHFYRTKDKTHYYCSLTPHKKNPKFGTSDSDRMHVMNEHLGIRLMYDAGYMSFDSVEALLLYREFFDIKDCK